MSKPDGTLLFLHLPKTGGSSLQGVLDRALPAGSVYHLAPDPRAAAQAFIAMPEAERHACRLIAGHQVYGLHRHAAPGARYIAMLRDPLSRVVSEMNYAYARHLRDETFTPELLCATLAGEAGPSPVVRDNLYTAWLGGESERAEIYNHKYEPDAACFDRAIHRLENEFAWVGVTERFYPSAVRLADMMGTRFRWLPRRNVARQMVRPVPGDAAWDNAIAAFRERNRWDQRLYDWALARMDAAITEEGLAERADRLERASRRVPLCHAVGYLRRHGVRSSTRRAWAQVRGAGR